MDMNAHAHTQAHSHAHTYKHIPSKMGNGTPEEFEKVMEGHGWS